jgi:transposase
MQQSRATPAAPRVDDRAALVGIVYHLRTGIPRRRLRDWQRAGVWQQLHYLLLEELSRQGRLDWSRASLDSVSVRAKREAA